MAIKVKSSGYREPKCGYILVILYDYIKKLPLHYFQMRRTENNCTGVFACGLVPKNSGHKTRPKRLRPRLGVGFGEKRRDNIVGVGRLFNPRR